MADIPIGVVTHFRPEALARRVRGQQGGPGIEAALGAADLLASFFGARAQARASTSGRHIGRRR